MATMGRRVASRGPGIDCAALDQLLCSRLHRAHLLAADGFNRSLSPWSITPQRFSALTVIAHNPLLKPADLARVLGIARSGAVPLVDALAALGLVERRDCPGDARACGLFVTAKGRRELRAMTRAVRAQDERLAHPLSREERLLLMRLVDRLTAERP